MNIKNALSDYLETPNDEDIRRIVTETFAMPGEHNYVILNDGAKPSNFMQAVPMDQPVAEHGCRVEYRDSELRKHFAANGVPVDKVIALFQQYNRLDQSFRKAIPWRNISRKFDWSYLDKAPGEPEQPSVSDALEHWATRSLIWALKQLPEGGLPFLWVANDDGKDDIMHFSRPAGPFNDEMFQAVRRELIPTYRQGHFYALAVDGVVNFEGAPQDALIVEVGERGTPHAFLYALRYHAGTTKVLGKPMIVDVTTSAWA